MIKLFENFNEPEKLEEYYSNGQKKSEEWLLNGEYHREETADQGWFKNGYKHYMIKIFEDFNIQQPFYLSKTDKLYLSDELVNKIKPNREKLFQISENELWIDWVLNKNQDFLNNTRNKIGLRKSTHLLLFISVSYNNYKMNLTLSNHYRKNQSGNFKYYLTGSSGDHDMHGKNMIRATRECNFNFMLKYYPIIKYIKNFYKKFKSGDIFLDIIENELINNPGVGKYGVPNELYKKYGHLEAINKYNI